MKNIRKYFVIAITVFLAALIMPVSTQAASQTVKLDKSKLIIYEGGRTTLKMTGTAKKVTWSSNKKSVVTVSSKGVVTAKKAGNAVITVKSGSKKASCKVAVKRRLSAKQAVSKINSQLKKARNITIKLYTGQGNNLACTIARGFDTKVTYIDFKLMNVPKMYIKDKKVYWYDGLDKQWYYFNNNEMEEIDLFDLSNNVITGKAKYKNLGVKTFNGKECAAIQVTDGGAAEMYYLDLADYSLIGISSGTGKEKLSMVFDLKKKVSIPSSVTKNAKYKEYEG